MSSEDTSSGSSSDDVLPGRLPRKHVVDGGLDATEHEQSHTPEVEGYRSGQTGDSSAPLTNVGPYKILQKIAEGGMGAVYMAEQKEPVRRQVALKVIKAGRDSKQVVARFEAERQALAMMDHPHIARIIDGGAIGDDRPYLVMELVKGIPITDYCDRNRLSIRERMQLLVSVCDAVQHAHTKGVMHRDLKPSNILVTDNADVPVPKVIDFGLAKATQHELRLTDKSMYTEYGQIVGTLRYMSPEQAESNQLDVDARTDVYSLGVLLYELLTGTTPLENETVKHQTLVQILKTIQEIDPPRPSIRLHDSGTLDDVSQQRKSEPIKLRTLLAGELDWITARALEKDRTRRYGTASALGDDLRRYLADEPVVARPPSAWYFVRKLTRRHRGKVAVACSTVLLLLAGLAGTGTMWYRASNAEKRANDEVLETQKALAEAKTERNRANVQQRLATNEAARASAESQRAQRAEATARFQLANVRFESGRVLEANRVLHEIPPSFRENFEWRYCNGLFQGTPRTLFGHRGHVNTVDVDSKGTRIASGGDDNVIRIWDLKSGAELRRLEGHRNLLCSLEFSPDGRSLATASRDGTIKIWDVVSGDLKRTIDGHDATVLRVSFNSDGSKLLSGSGDSSMRIWDVKSGKQIREFDPHDGYVIGARFSPDDSKIASACNNRLIYLWDAETGERVELVGHPQKAWGVHFSPDGKRLVSAGRDEVVLWDVETKELLRVIPLTRHAMRVKFDPSGQWLFLGEDDGNITLLDVETGRQEAMLFGHTDAIADLSFTPDGQLVTGSYDGTVKIWETDANVRSRTFTAHQGISDTVCLDPSRNRVYSGGGDMRVRISDAQSGTEIGVLGRHGGNIFSVVLNKDASRLYSASSEKLIKVWDLEGLRELDAFEGHEAEVSCLALHPSRPLLVSGGWDNAVKLWDLETGTWLRDFESHDDRVSSVCFSPGGDQVISASWDETIRICETATGKLLHRLTGHTDFVFSLCLSPDGKQIVSAGKDKTIRFWALKSGEQLREIQTVSYPRAVLFHPDGNRLFSGGEDGKITIWDTESGQEMLQLTGQSAAVQGLAISEDGQKLVSASNDSTVCIWDALRNPEARRYPGHREPIQDVCFNQEGTKFFSKSASESFTWDIETGERSSRRTDSPEPEWGKKKTPDGRWEIFSSGRDIIIVDREFRR